MRNQRSGPVGPVERRHAFAARRDAGPGTVSLIVIGHDDALLLGTRFLLECGETAVIGSSADAEINLPGDSTVSHRHALVRHLGARVVVQDLGAAGGTRINGRALDCQGELGSGDRLELGRVCLKVLAQWDVEAAYHEAMLDRARRDGLTGALSRGAFDAELRTEVLRARRYRRPLSLILLDLDGFKAINDRHGHVAGDLTLVRVCCCLGESLRSEQLLARVGGDELAVLCPETAAGQAHALAERLRAQIAVISVAGDLSRMTVTGSFGVAELEPASDDAAGLYRAADRALYAAKRAGGNQVRVWRQLAAAAAMDDEPAAAVRWQLAAGFHGRRAGAAVPRPRAVASSLR